jgi:hypothetical protein
VEKGMPSGWTEAVQHRLMRIDRKLESLKSEVGSLGLLDVSDF